MPQRKKTPPKIPPQKPAKTRKVRSAAIRLCAVAPCRFRTTWRCTPAPAAKRKATKTKPAPLEMHRQVKRRSSVSVPVKYVHRELPPDVLPEHTGNKLHSPINTLDALVLQRVRARS